MYPFLDGMSLEGVLDHALLGLSLLVPVSDISLTFKLNISPKSEGYTSLLGLEPFSPRMRLH